MINITDYKTTMLILYEETKDREKAFSENRK